MSDLDSGSGYATLGLSQMSSELMNILMNTEDIVPGDSPSYQACKTLYAYHPIASRMVDKPLEMAMSQERTYAIPGAPEEELIKAFKREWKKIGGIGANQLIYRLAQIARIYGIGTLACNILDGGEKAETNEPLPMDGLHKADLVFYVFDPLNSAGSLILNQDPNAVDFMHSPQVRIGGDSWNSSKTCVMMNEQPIWIEWTDSAFGFVGRSVYQRAFYPLKTFVSSMIADNLIQEKLALIVHKAKTPGSIVDRRALSWFGIKRQQIKGAKTGNVIQIGVDEDMESLNLDHVHTAGEYSRDNCLKNIALASGMPAILLNEETLAKGFGEGSEDAKQIARYIDRIRIDLEPAYRFLDAIVQRRAWNNDLFLHIQELYPEQYGKLTYEAAYQEWIDSYDATWPNLLTEPDSEKAKAAESRVKAASDIAEKILPHCDQENKALIVDWLAQVANNEKDLFSEPLMLDVEAIAAYEPPLMMQNENED